MDKLSNDESQPVVLSPEPIRPSRLLKTNAVNPFDEASTVSSFNDDCDRENVCTELSFILSSPIIFPTSKSLPSPLFGRPCEKYPTRHKINPIVHDEYFLRFDKSHDYDYVNINL